MTMSRGLIDYLTYAYTFLCKGRGRLDADSIRAIQNGADTITKTAPVVLMDDSTPAGRELALDLEEANMINNHIEQATVWLLSLENV